MFVHFCLFIIKFSIFCAKNWYRSKLSYYFKKRKFFFYGNWLWKDFVFRFFFQKSQTNRWKRFNFPAECKSCYALAWPKASIPVHRVHPGPQSGEFTLGWWLGLTQYAQPNTTHTAFASTTSGHLHPRHFANAVRTNSQECENRLEISPSFYNT